MRIASSPRLLQVGREEKEAKLREFVSEDLAQRAAKSGSQKSVTYTLIARAPDSPVVRVLHDMKDVLQKSRIKLQAILLETDAMSEDRAEPSRLDYTHIDVRLFSDVRFAAAHEQLVVSPTRLWLGDCMRRDPIKRDAFEIYHDDNAIAARYAKISFERLWNAAKPVRRYKTAASEFVIASQNADNPPSRPASRR